MCLSWQSVPKRAKNITRGEDFYHAEKLEWALNTFREVMHYISAAYYPASLVFYPMESNLGYRSGVSQEVLAALDDEQVNVYRDVCNQLVLPSINKEEPDVVGVSIGTQMQLLAGADLLQNDQGRLSSYPCHSGAEMSLLGCRRNYRIGKSFSPRFSTRRFCMRASMLSSGCSKRWRANEI